MSMLLVVTLRLWSIIGDSGSVVSSVGPLALVLVAAHERNPSGPQTALGPRFSANGLTFCANSSQTSSRAHIGCQASLRIGLAGCRAVLAFPAALTEWQTG